MNLDDVVQSVIRKGNGKRLSEEMYGIGGLSNSGLKKNKKGQFDLSNFAFDEFENADDHKTLELSPEEQDLNNENEDMFSPRKTERNPDNPYLTKHDKQEMGIDETDDDSDNPNDSDDSDDSTDEDNVVKFGMTENGISVTICGKTGYIQPDDYQNLIDFVKSAMTPSDNEQEDSDDD